MALVGTLWVLAGRYGADRTSLSNVVDGLLKSREIRIERADVVRQALHLFSTSTDDFADCLIECGGRAVRCDDTVTFDVKAAKSCGMRLLG